MYKALPWRGSPDGLVSVARPLAGLVDSAFIQQAGEY
jgi:hypothetical protein